MPKDSDSMCPHTSQCSFYTSKSNSTYYEVYKALYCDAGYERCEIYKMIESGKEPPANMWPDGSAGA